jgi:hypothetical protein
VGADEGGASTAPSRLVAQTERLQPRGELHRRRLLRPVHHAGVSERALVESTYRRDRRAEIALDQ